MFFREIKEIRERPTGSTDSEINAALRKQRKYCLLPDVVITNLVDKKVKYREEHGSKKNITESIVPQRIFVMHDIIEITRRDEEIDDYAVVDEPVHQCILEYEDTPGRKGKRNRNVK